MPRKRSRIEREGLGDVLLDLLVLLLYGLLTLVGATFLVRRQA